MSFARWVAAVLAKADREHNPFVGTKTLAIPHTVTHC